MGQERPIVATEHRLDVVQQAFQQEFEHHREAAEDAFEILGRLRINKSGEHLHNRGEQRIKFLLEIARQCGQQLEQRWERRALCKLQVMQDQAHNLLFVAQQQWETLNISVYPADEVGEAGCQIQLL
jgi:hypothetical protein